MNRTGDLRCHKSGLCCHITAVALDSEPTLADLRVELDMALRRVLRHQRGRRAVLVTAAATSVGWSLTRIVRSDHPADEDSPLDTAVPTQRPTPSTRVLARPGPASPVPVLSAPSATGPSALPDPGDVSGPLSLLVLVDRWRQLPDGWSPPDLVVPSVRFTFNGDHEKRHLRSAAASALERLVAAAADDGLVVRGVSGFRSQKTQADLWDLAVRRKGEAEATRTNARPGHSEHQTGLAIDVTDGRSNLLDERFADTPTSSWLSRHAHRFGYIIRYPARAESVTGYRYEPWHLRYVGQAASEIVARGLTLEQYLGAA